MRNSPQRHALLARSRSADAGLQINLGRFEVLPAACARVRGAQAQRDLPAWVLRDRREARLLAGRALRSALAARGIPLPQPGRSAAQARRLHKLLGLTGALRELPALPAHAEPEYLVLAGRDRYARPLWLTAMAASAWRRMRRAARAEGVVLEAISGFRSLEHQAAIIRRKLARGQTPLQILQVNAAPGFSEHHTGRAIDICTPGEPAAEESFEATSAFVWLQRRARAFGFRMSYPRDGASGIQYEPWHWCWHPPTVMR